TATLNRPHEIADAVTQSNTKILSEAPALAVATIYQALSHAIARLLEQATVAQQNTDIVAQASISEALTLLYRPLSVASTASLPETTMTPGTEAPSAPPATGSAAPDLLAEPEPVEPAQSEPPETEHDRRPSYNGVNLQIEQAIKQSNQIVLGAAGDVAYAQRASTEAFAAGLRQISDAQHRQRLQLLQTSATAVCLDAMIKSPETAGDYTELLEIIKHMV
ncbi:MAG: RebB family R body protein, partial [Lysobacter sp.]